MPQWTSQSCANAFCIYIISVNVSMCKRRYHGNKGSKACQLLPLSVSFHQPPEGINIEASHLITATGFADEMIQFAKILTSSEQSLVVIRVLAYYGLLLTHEGWIGCCLDGSVLSILAVKGGR
uniref:Uncharacterized protein n=1 Tax=Micrurus carvalhoi TaxID=3147026 RepID=A0A2H6NFG7_9SAUR